MFRGAGVRASRFRHRLLESERLFDHLVKHLEVGEGAWLGHDWKKFENQEPALGVMGGSGSRERAIAQFNAPFFPDAIVSTSVLREGVDLHLSCRRVWHYGLPASPGALEQQTGRVDRYFARVHRALEDSRTKHLESWESYRPLEAVDAAGEETLEVGFPYLPRSVDQTQLERLLLRKGRIQPVMDRGLSVADTDEEVALDSYEARSPEELLAAFREGVTDGGDPFTADRHLSQESRSSEERDGEDVTARFERALEEVAAAIEAHDRLESVVGLRLEGLSERTPLMLINTYIMREGEALRLSSEYEEGARHQPTLLHLRYISQVGLYALELDTPLTEDDSHLEELRELLLREYPTQGCTLVREKSSDHIGDWMIRLVASIPFEAGGPEGCASLRADRVIERLETLMCVADELEHRVIDEDIESGAVARHVDTSREGE
jgi:hypothetical protein